MIKYYSIVQQKIKAVSEEEASIITFINPDENEKTIIKTTFDIDEHTLGSSLDNEEVARIEIDEKLIILWKYPRNYSVESDLSFNISSVGLILCCNKLIIITDFDFDYFRQDVKFKINCLYDAFLVFFDATLKHFIGHLKVIKFISKEIQNKINESMENKYLIQMFNLSESLVYYQSALNSNNLVLHKLQSYLQKKSCTEETLDFIEDIIIENTQANNQAEIYSNVFSGLMDARGNLINNNMNVLIKKLTIINVVFLPLNLIASALGMSEFSMMTQTLDWKITYPVFGLSMLIIGFITAFFVSKMQHNQFRKKNEMKSLIKKSRKKLHG